MASTPPPAEKPASLARDVTEVFPPSDVVHNTSPTSQGERVEIDAQDVSFEDLTMQSSSPTGPLTSIQLAEPPALVNTQRIATPGEFMTRIHTNPCAPCFA